MPTRTPHFRHGAAIALVFAAASIGAPRAQPSKPLQPVKRTWFVSHGKASGTANGTARLPYATLDEALKQATVGDEIHVAHGLYDGPVDAKAGVTIRGGYDDDFKRPTPLDDDSFTSPDVDTATQTILTNARGDRVVLASRLGGEATISNLVIEGPDIRLDLSSRSSRGVVVQHAGTLRLERVKIVAGRGGEGRPGETGARGTGLCTAGGGRGQASTQMVKVGELCGSFSGKCIDIHSRCVSHAGEEGGSVTGLFGARLSYGGNGGQPGASWCEDQKDVHSDGGDGGRGQPGQEGATGDGGTAGRNLDGGMVLLDGVVTWRGDIGTEGVAGWPGAGGGGGGAGGSFTCNGKDVLGGMGGAGGRSGCGGARGGPGGPGGGSFGVVVSDAMLIIDNVGSVMGAGGQGGAGGAGGAGATGEQGSPGSGGASGSCGVIFKSPFKSGDGGPGGAGGAGGLGGGGAGGNGGIAVGIARTGSATIERSGMLVISGGQGGSPGAGGNRGEPGRTGWVRQEQSFTSAGVEVRQSFNARTNQYYLSTGSAPSSDWRDGGVVFLAFTTQEPGTEPVYVETPKAAPHSRYFFSRRGSYWANATGWLVLSPAFYAYAEARPGTVPVYVETPTKAPDTTFRYSTRSAAEAARDGWTQMTVAFHAPAVPRK